MLFQSMQRLVDRGVDHIEANYDFWTDRAIRQPGLSRLHFIEHRYADIPPIGGRRTAPASKAMLRSAGLRHHCSSRGRSLPSVKREQGRGLKNSALPQGAMQHDRGPPRPPQNLELSPKQQVPLGSPARPRVETVCRQWRLRQARRSVRFSRALRACWAVFTDRSPFHRKHESEWRAGPCRRCCSPWISARRNLWKIDEWPRQVGRYPVRRFPAGLG